MIETKVSGPDRRLLYLDATFKWPTDEFTDQHPVEGFEVAPVDEPDRKRGVELLFGLGVRKQGRYQARAIAVDYTVDGKEHTAYIRRAISVCVIPASQDLDADCASPTGVSDPIEPGT